MHARPGARLNQAGDFRVEATCEFPTLGTRILIEMPSSSTLAATFGVESLWGLSTSCVDKEDTERLHVGVGV